MSAVSPIIGNILRQNSSQHPCIYLKGVEFKQIQSLLTFIYQGQVFLEPEDINDFLEIGKDLNIIGMSAIEMPDSICEQQLSVIEDSMQDIKEKKENIKMETVVEPFLEDEDS